MTNQQSWLRRLDAETANLRGALDGAAADGDARLARRLVHAMVWYWFLRGRVTEAKRSLAVPLAVEERAVNQNGGARAASGQDGGAPAVIGENGGAGAESGEEPPAMPATARGSWPGRPG